MREWLWRLILVGGGGACGCVARDLVQGWCARLTQGFPLGTLAVNAVGSTVIGVLMALFLGPLTTDVRLKVLLTVGVLGGFTTFSSFAFETVQLANDGEWTRATANILLNNALALVGALIGFRLAGRAWGM